jgi:2-aminoadipate transaminase
LYEGLIVEPAFAAGTGGCDKILTTRPDVTHPIEVEPMLPEFSRWLSNSNDITQQFLAIGGMADFISMAGGLPAAEFYPTEAISNSAVNALSRWGASALEYGPVEGFPALRQHIAERMSKKTGRKFTPENVLLTAGAMQGLDLVGKVLIDPGQKVVAQFPTYVGALDAWRPRSPAYEPLDWSIDGNASPDRLRSAKFVYAVPNYSNPTGVLVPTSERQALLDKVIEAKTWLVEDDPYATLDYDGKAGPSILELHGNMEPNGAYSGPIIYLGTLSKSIVPGLRVGWVIAAPSMIGALTIAKQSSDLSSSMLTHAIALDLLESGLEERHVPEIVEQYRRRRDALCRAASADLAEWFEWEVPPGGMFAWMTARDPKFNTDRLYSHALAGKVAFVPGSVFDPAGKLHSAMRVNFTRNTPDKLKMGVARLADATRHYLASGD